MEMIVATLVALIVVQQAVFLLSIHKLVNKVMSGNYADYAASENQRKVSKQKIIKVPLPPEEDLGVLNDFSPI
jgi:hypothetical protein